MSWSMDRKLQRHRADSLRQHGFLVYELMCVLAFHRVTPKAEGSENETPKKCGGVSPQLTSAVSFPVGSMAEPWPKTNLVYSRTARKPVVAITLIIQCQNKIAVTRLITYSPCVEYGWLCFSFKARNASERLHVKYREGSWAYPSPSVLTSL